MNNRGSRFVTLNSTACPGNWDTKVQKRWRRSPRQTNYWYTTQQPYRVVKGCGMNRRKRVLTVCDTDESYNMTGDIASADYFDRRDFEARMGNDPSEEAAQSRMQTDSHPAGKFLKKMNVKYLSLVITDMCNYFLRIVV